MTIKTKIRAGRTSCGGGGGGGGVVKTLPV
jgi:hypothetical protein